MASKLHLPLLTGGESGIESLGIRPVCNRQLSNNRASRVQSIGSPAFAEGQAQFLAALLSGKACRHCAVASRLLVRTVTRVVSEEDSEDE